MNLFSTDPTNQNISETSTIHDRIKPKGNNTNATSQDKTQNTGKKQVKILQKDESKLKKASEAVESQQKNNNTTNEDEGLIQELEDKKKQRCKYYPNCKNEKTCPFIHPTEPCSFFPTCKYGGQCINKHPECKFGKSCQRPDCFYDHPFPKKPNMNPFLQMLMMPMMGGPQKRKIPGKFNGKRPFPGNQNQSQAGGHEEVKNEEKQQS